MNSDNLPAEKNLDLSRFVCSFLKNQGSVLEYRNNDVIDALLPEKLSKALDVEEYISLSKDSENVKNFGGDKLYSIQFQSPLLDKIVSIAGDRAPVLHAELKFNYIKTQGFYNLIREQFEFHKSKIKVTGTGEIKTRYILMTCKFIAESDEQKQGLLDFSFNLDTGAVIPDMLSMMPGLEKEFKTDKVQKNSAKEIRRMHELVSLYGPGAVEKKLNDFLNSMNRRFKRDSLSLDQYYKALKQEMEDSLSGARISERLIQERKEKIALIPDELAAKKKDLLNKYSIKIRFTPVAVLSVISPCVKVFVSLFSGHRKKDISIIYNPVIKQMEPMVCNSCGMSTCSLGLCKNMDLNCTDCLNRDYKF